MSKSEKKFNFQALKVASYFIFPLSFFLESNKENQKIRKESMTIFGLLLLGRILDLIQFSFSLSILDFSFISILLALSAIGYDLYNLLLKNKVIFPVYALFMKLLEKIKLQDKFLNLISQISQKTAKIHPVTVPALILVFLLFGYMVTLPQTAYYFTIKAVAQNNLKEFKANSDYSKIYKSAEDNTTSNISKEDFYDKIDFYIENGKLDEKSKSAFNQIIESPFSMFTNEDITFEKEGASYKVTQRIEKKKYSYTYRFNGSKWVVTDLKMI
jgi:hypothetical protein